MKNISKVSGALKVTLLLLGLSACTQKTASDHLQSAKQMMAEGNNKGAVIELKNAVIAAPTSAEIRMLLGQAYFQERNFVAAEKELLRALESDELASQVLPYLVQTYYYQGDFESAVKLSEQQEDLAASEAKEILGLFGYLSAIRLGPEQQKEAEVPEGLGGDRLLIARAYEALLSNQLQKAEDFIGQFSDEEALSVEKEFIAGLLAFRQADFARAARHYDNVLATMPNLHPVRFQLVEALLNSGAYEEAEQQVDRILAISKENAFANLLKAKLRFHQKQYNESLRLAEKSIQNGMDNKVAQIVAGISAYKQGQLETAYRYLTRAAQDVPHDHAVKKLLAQVQLSLGYTSEARSNLDKLNILKKEDADLFAQTAMQLASKGQLDAAQDYLVRANNADSEDAENLMREGIVKLADSDYAGTEDIRKALENDPELDKGWVVLANAHLNEGETDKALEVARRWQQSHPASGLTLEGVIYQQLNRLPEAEQALKKATEKDPKHLGANQYLTNLYVSLGQYSKALAQTHSLLKSYPDNLLALTNLVRLSLTLSEEDQVLPRLNAHISRHPRLLNPKLVLAEYYRAQEEAGKAVELLEPLSHELTPEGWSILSDAYVQLKDLPNARSSLKHWRTRFPGDAQAWLRSAGVEELSGNLDGALKVVQDSRQTLPDAQRLRLLEVGYLTRLGRLDEARTLLTQMRQQMSGGAILTRFDGELALASGDFRLAEGLLRDYYKAEPSFASATLLARALQKNDRADEAAKLLELEFSKLTNPSMEYHTLAEFYTHNEMYDKAAQTYRQFLAKNPEHFLTLNNLAHVKLKQSDYPTALELARKAHSLAPQMPQVMDTLGWAYFKVGDLNQAQEYLTHAASRLRNNADVQMNLAAVLIAQGKKTEARSLLTSLSPDNESQQQRLRTLIESLKTIGA
ncbi:XrtA/PEP-CTERM system TPR-repeat protein PrsT [Bowmanella dokdonensis]|uniref:PEP-CTERM system TPR-repeat protein PrsT n=1 Tax=Bowmanella dokdonensis TaxID=751969 RepID=A0A939DR76_9ALTE|nr:XrtA/PEP-CTERM system TPR-repeat protein PrsT [Bowmanella dokdonensis]MBN7827300.1 PEP-CTERM system TPR-repeat protein PrsT [Bowmanella dokdonensis]